jgi:hypothetical protein
MMRFNYPGILATLLVAVSISLTGSVASASRQSAALVPLAISGDNDASLRNGTLDRAIVDKLSDRFDIRILSQDGKSDPGALTNKARSLGTPYLFEGSLVRIGRSVSIELRIVQSEPGAIGKTVVASALDDAEGQAPPSGGLPPIYRRLITEATANLKLRFFGDDRAGGKGRIPGFSGNLTRSAAFPGNPVSARLADSDRDGKRELIVAFPSEIAIFRIDGDELVEKYRIKDAGTGIFRVETADLDHNGFAEIIAVRFAGGQAISDIWAFDGKDYRKKVAGIPWLLSPVALDKGGSNILGQESDPVTFFKGDIFRLAFDRYGEGEIPDKGGALPLPPGTGLYSVGALNSGQAKQIVVFGKGGSISLYQPEGKALGAASESIRGTDFTPAAVSADSLREGPINIPPRFMAVDLNDDGIEELVALNNLVTPGVFFENVKVQSGAELVAFVQDAGTLRLAWRTPQIGFGVTDAFLVDAEKGPARRIGLLVREKGKLLENLSEWRIVWMR